MRPRITLIFFAGLLVAGLGWQLVPKAAPLPGKGQHLAQALAGDIPGRVARDVTLGPSEAGSAEVANILRFDDVFYRQYSSASGDRVSLYVAYWNPGKMPVQLVASHTPDICWTESGWQCVESRYPFVVGNEAGPLKPAQERVFKAGDTELQHVAFWHLVGPDLYDYGEDVHSVPHPLKWWRDVARSLWSRPQEQYFIRLSADRPLEELANEAGFKELVARLGKLGLRQ